VRLEELLKPYLQGFGFPHASSLTPQAYQPSEPNLQNQPRFRDILATVCDIIGAKKAGFLGYDSQEETLSCVEFFGLTTARQTGVSFRLGEGIAGWTAQQTNCTVINNVQQYPYLIDELVQTLAENSFLSTPIFYQDQLLGVLILAGKNPAPGAIGTGFNFEDQQKLTWLTPLLSQIIQLMSDNHGRLASIGELVAGIAHEIRNPLAGIMTTAETLKENLDADDHRKEYLERIINEINRMNHFLVKFFAFARPQKPQYAPTYLPDILDKIFELEGKNFEDKKITLIREYPPDLPEIYLDASQIQQVLLNLTLNAVQAMPQGGRLRVSIKPGGNLVHLLIADTGVGIPPENINKIFDPFFTTKPKGVGLGLAVSQRIIKEHGGAIQVYSRVGQGTTFRVNLPINSRL